MSYGLTLYAVDFATLTRAIGGADATLAATICADQRADLDELAEWFADEIGEGAPSPDAVVHALIAGQIGDAHGFMWVYGFERLVAQFGEMLDNEAFYPCDDDYLEDVDAALAELGAPEGLATARLQYGTLPIRLPSPDDFPGSGSWAPELVAAGHAALADAELDDVDEDVAEAVAAVREWLAEAADRGLGIVAFYY